MQIKLAKSSYSVSLFSLFIYLIYYSTAAIGEEKYPWWSQEITECDRQASHGRDPYHVAPGVSQSSMNFSIAKAACLAAVEKDPNNPRLNYQLGRIYGYSGQWQKGMPYRMKAVELEYPQSLFVIGWLYLTGDTIDEKDTCKTHDMWVNSAELGRLAAQVALPRYYLMGEFQGCDNLVAIKELQRFLSMAKDQTDDFYTGMLIEDLTISISTRTIPDD
jgi:tetratricopeptide (TPR) repeat protein